MRTKSCLKVCRAFFMTIALCLLATSNAHACSPYYVIVLEQQFVLPSSMLIALFLEVSAISMYFKKSCELKSVKFRLSLYALNIFTPLFLFLVIIGLDFILSIDDLLFASLISLAVAMVLLEGYFICRVLNIFFLTDKKVSFLKCIAVSVAGNIIYLLSFALAFYTLHDLAFDLIEHY